MGLDLSTQGCAAGPRSLFSLDDWRQWSRNKGYGAAVGVRGRYHVNERLTTKYVLTDKILGTGMNGPVFLARGKAGTALKKREFAVKTFKKLPGMVLGPVKNEVMITLSLDHPNIARLEDVFDMPSEIYMVMELLEGEELFDRVRKKGRYTEDVARDAVRSMCQSVAYLHSQKPPIVHRDLKPENFVYERKDSNRLKLIDFGLSAMWDKRVAPKMEQYCGTENYKAPEVFRRQPYTEKCDLFSLGVIAYVLVTGHPPFVDAGDMYKYRPFDQETFLAVSPDGKSFVRSLLSREPVDRPSAEDALKLPWLQKRQGAAAQGAVLDESVLKSMRMFSNASRFKRTCLSMMAWSLTAEDREHLRSCFIQMDRNGDGRISLNEMRMALEENFSINNAEADELFKKLDDGDDEICYTDFLAIAMQESVRMHEDVLVAAFARFDRGGKGMITAADLRCMLDEDFQECNAEEILKELDATGSGYISCQAFMDYLTAQEEEEEQQAEAEEVNPQAASLRPAVAAPKAAVCLFAQRSPVAVQVRDGPQLPQPPRPRPSFTSRLGVSPKTPQSELKSRLAARLIDGQRRRAQQTQGGGRFATFAAPSSRQWRAPDPLQRFGEDRVPLKTF